MSEAQRCANVMRQYGLKHPPDSIQRGCFAAACSELERITALEQQLAAAKEFRVEAVKLADDHLRLNRLNAELRARVEELEIICSESYQVVGNLSYEHGVFCNEKTTKALDNLSQQKRIHHDVLPYQSASFEKDAALQPKEPT